MSHLAELQIEFKSEANYLSALLAPAGNQNSIEILNAFKRIKRIAKEGIKASKLIIPSFLALPITGEHTQRMTDLTDKRWEEGL